MILSILAIVNNADFMTSHTSRIQKSQIHRKYSSGYQKLGEEMREVDQRVENFSWKFSVRKNKFHWTIAQKGDHGTSQ